MHSEKYIKNFPDFYVTIQRFWLHSFRESFFVFIHWKNGLYCFSLITVVSGPCPGKTVVFSGNVKIFVLIACNNCSILPPKSVLPILP